MISGKIRSKTEHLEKDGKLSLLKFAAVFGANASGKTNLVSAMRISKSIILKGMRPGLARDFCKIYPENKNKTTSFEYEIKIGNKYYAYGFDIILSESIIVGEWLYEIGPKGKNDLIFEREPKRENKHFTFGNKYNIPVMETFMESMETNTSTLFLTEMNSNKGDIYNKIQILRPIREIYLWFAEKLSVNPVGIPPVPQPFYVKEDFDIKLASQIISSLGLGIENVSIEEGTVDELRSTIPSELLNQFVERAKTDITNLNRAGVYNSKSTNMMIGFNRQFFIVKVETDTLEIHVRKLKFEHEGNHVLFDLSEESDGTRRMMDLIELLFAAYNGNDKVYIIDEIDRSLHPQLTYQLIKSYLQMVDRGNMQLIVTTHESHIMDLNLLRQDEIWFVNKTRMGESELYSLDQYNERFDRKVDKAYLDGRYGSVPIFDYYFPMNLEGK